VGPILWKFFECDVSVLQRPPRQRDSRSLSGRDSIFWTAAGGGASRRGAAVAQRTSSARPVIGSAQRGAWRLDADRRSADRIGADRTRTRPRSDQHSSDQRSAARLGARTAQASTGRGRDGSARERHGSALAPCAVGTAQHSTGRESSEQCSTSRCRSARLSAARGRDGSAPERNAARSARIDAAQRAARPRRDQRGGAAHRMRRSPDQKASMSHFVAWHLFKKYPLIEQSRRLMDGNHVKIKCLRTHPEHC
jgi:hypothetical protein